MAGYFDSAGDYVEIADSSFLDLITGDGWTFSFFVKPDSAQFYNTWNYIYSHEEPFNFQPAFNVLMDGFDNSVRIIVDWAGGNLVDYTTTLQLVDDAWNRIIITYNGTSITFAINGSTETTTPPVLPDIQPSSVARIGNSTVSPIGSRWFPGSIMHAAQWSRSWTTSDAAAFSETFLSPEFAQNQLDWHIEMFTGAAWDLNRNISTTPTGMSWAPHGPVIYPGRMTNGPGSEAIIAAANSFAYYRSA